MSRQIKKGDLLKVERLETVYANRYVDGDNEINEALVYDEVGFLSQGDIVVVLGDPVALPRKDAFGETIKQPAIEVKVYKQGTGTTGWVNVRCFEVENG